MGVPVSAPVAEVEVVPLGEAEVVGKKPLALALPV